MSATWCRPIGYRGLHNMAELELKGIFSLLQVLFVEVWTMNEIILVKKELV